MFLGGRRPKASVILAVVVDLILAEWRPLTLRRTALLRSSYPILATIRLRQTRPIVLNFGFQGNQADATQLLVPESSPHSFEFAASCPNEVVFGAARFRRGFPRAALSVIDVSNE